MDREKTMLSVTQLNEYLKMLLDGDRVLSNLYICGEISNFKLYASGHAYLTLKDATGQLKAVMFRSYAARLRFRPEDGMRVIAHGHVSVYEATGQYQLYIDDMQPDGIGSLAMQYEQLRRKLEAEGLFDAARKRPLPTMPRRIGVITSPSGAAVHDIQTVLGRRFPCAEMLLFPSAVQGAEAPEQLRMGIEFFGMTSLCDVIIIGRGGGSIEDLWAFNDERLARAIAACPIPVISAVGPERDFTICDFVADKRAPTPSAAAELAVPDQAELKGYLQTSHRRMQQLVGACITREQRYLSQMASSPVFKRPERIFERFRLALGESERVLEGSVRQLLDTRINRLQGAAARLEALSPMAVLTRGYATVSREGKTVSSAKALQQGDTVSVRFFDGSVRAVVQSEKGEHENGI